MSEKDEHLRETTSPALREPQGLTTTTTIPVQEVHVSEVDDCGTTVSSLPTILPAFRPYPTVDDMTSRNGTSDHDDHDDDKGDEITSSQQDHDELMKIILSQQRREALLDVTNNDTITGGGAASPEELDRSGDAPEAPPLGVTDNVLQVAKDGKTMINQQESASHAPPGKSRATSVGVDSSAPPPAAHDGQPGAYALAPAPTTSMEQPIVEALPEQPTAQGEESSDKGPLIEARLVTDDSQKEVDIAEARPISSVDAVGFCLNSPLKKCLALLVCLGTVALVVALVVQFQQRNGEEEEEDPTLTTLAPSVAPTQVPSMAPTIAITQRILPIYTREAISADPIHSPQAKAWNWTLNDPNLLSYSLKRNLQRFALATLYYATDGASSWITNTGWLDYNTSECSNSYLFFADMGEDKRSCNENDEMEHLSLNDNNLVGTIPPELALITSLQQVEMNGNPDLTGTLPDTFWEPPLYLTHLDFGTSGISGNFDDIPLARLTSLRKIEIEETPLWTGTLPSEFGLCTLLQELQINSNMGMIPGRIPSQFGLLTQLSVLQLNSMQLTGTIPTEIGRMESMKNLRVRSNSLTGTLPTEVGLLSNLRKLEFPGSLLTGPIPSELGLLSGVVEVRLDNNGFISGTLPTEICSMTGTQELFLQTNSLSGSIPTCIGKLSALAELEMISNRFTGTVPTQFGSMSLLVKLNLGDSALTGQLPSELGLLSQLKSMEIRGTQLDGFIPSELGQLQALEEIDISDSQLEGPLPSQLGFLFRLERFVIANNKVNGTLPKELLSLPGLVSLDIQNTALTGVIPNQTCEGISEFLYDCSDTLCGCDCHCAVSANVSGINTTGSSRFLRGKQSSVLHV